MADSSITEQIALKTKAIADAMAKAASHKSSGDQWKAQSLVACSGTKSKKAACEADKAYKAAKAQEHYGVAAAQTTLANNLRKEIDVLSAQQKAQNDATVNLSTQGKSLEALVTESKGMADAAVTSATIESNARASAIQTDATADADSQKKITYIVVAVGAVILIVVAITLVKKFGKKKRKK